MKDFFLTKIALFLTLLFTCSVFSQENIEHPNSELPNLSPLSPKAFQFTKYGDVPVNESTGAISPSIPFYNFTAGDITIPISLSYSGNGVKVAQEPTWSGINWSMMPGGVITRQVRDLPDEGNPALGGFSKVAYSKDQLDELEGFGYLDPDIPNNNYFNITTSEWYQTMNNIASSSVVDSETDIFNYNFLGYSGSFYLNDDNTKGVLLNFNKEIDITFQYQTGNKSRIEIITPEGDTYYFGGSDASESSRSWTNSAYTRGITFPTQNAFYLYRIKPYNRDPNNSENQGTVEFVYDQIQESGIYYGYTVDKQQSLTKQEDTYHPCGTGGYKLHNTVEVYNEIESLVYLKRIESTLSNNYIEFSSSALGNRKRKLNSVYIKDGQDNTIKQFDLTYDTVDKDDGEANKFYLTKVDFIDRESNVVYDYEMVYNSPNLIPDRWSKAQDHAGYYNGMDNNPNLLPNDDPRFDNTIALANRETDKDKIQYGVLEKIIYPTGGYSEFEYESPIKGYETVSHENSIIRVYENNPYDGTNQHDEELWMGGVNGDAFFPLQANDIVTVNLNTDTEGSFTDHDQVIVTAVNYTNNLTHEIGTSELGYYTESPNSIPKIFTFIVPDTGSYTFRLELTLPTAASIPPRELSVFSTARFNIPNNDPTSQEPIYYPAIRIKRITSKEGINEDPVIKRYYYNSIYQYLEDNNTLIASPQYVTRTTSFVPVCAGGGSKPPATYLNLSANTINNAYSDDSGNVLYPIVTTSYGGNNFELGAKQSIFRVYPEQPIYRYLNATAYNGEDLDVPVPYATSGYSVGNGTVLSERYFTSFDPTNEEPKLIKHIVYVNSILEPAIKKHNIKPGIVHTAQSTGDIRKYNFSLYPLFSQKNILRKIITYDYQLAGDPINEPIETIQTFAYDKYVDRHASITSTDSKGVDSKVEYFYPGDELVNNDHLTPTEELAITQLSYQHRISQPYMTKSYQKNLTTGVFEIQSSNQTIFKDWDNNKIWPQYFRTAKGINGELKKYDNAINNPYEDRVEFISYNDYGRPHEVKQKNGSVIKYFYDNKQRVTMKVENYDLADIDDSISPSDPCYYQKFYKNTLVTVYDYDVNNGNLISIQDPKCYTIYYEYDDFNRLKRVKDAEDNIVSENEYHYKDQQ